MDWLLKLKEQGADSRTGIYEGLTALATMALIIFVDLLNLLLTQEVRLQADFFI